MFNDVAFNLAKLYILYYTILYYRYYGIQTLSKKTRRRQMKKKTDKNPNLESINKIFRFIHLKDACAVLPQHFWGIETFRAHALKPMPKL